MLLTVCLGILKCSCNRCGKKNFCTIDTRKGEKCLLRMETNSDGIIGSQLTMDCTNTALFHCQGDRYAMCCATSDLCNHISMPTNDTGTLEPPPPSASSPSTSSPSTSSPSTSSTSAPSDDTFPCHCSNCSSHSCRTSHYCVAATVGTRTEYGCVHSKTSMLFRFCEIGMPGFRCCKHSNCNTEIPTLPPSQPQTEDSDSTVTPKRTGCEHLSKGCGSHKDKNNEMKDSEFIVILVSITVPSFFIFVALAVIFCYTVKKYHKQAEARKVMQGTTISAHNGVSKMSNGKLHMGILED